jgi:sec-independent protein translocase protein TatA
MLGIANPTHLLMLLAILLLVFGAKRLPEIGSSLGAGLRGFKDSVSSDAAHLHLHESVAATAQPAPDHALAAATAQPAPDHAPAAATAQPAPDPAPAQEPRL